MTQTERKILKQIKDKPYKIANAVGFTDVKEKPHNEWMQSVIFGKGDYTLLAHRGSYKSSCLSVCIALLMVIKPTINILFFRKTDTDVSEMLNMVSKALQSKAIQNISNIIYGEPVYIVKQNANTITTNLYQSSSGAEQLLGLGIKTSITGKHADLVITDDICNISDRVSKAERDKTKTQFMELQNIRNRGGRIVSLGTKWHKDDVFNLMDNISTYTYKDTGLISEEQIAKLKQQMTASLFACNYELKIVADDDVIFTDPIINAEPEKILNGYSHCDAAFYGEDYTAFTIAAYHDDCYYVFGKCWRKHIDDVMDEIVKLYNKHLCGKLYIERNADKGYVAKEFRSKGVRTVSYHESENKYVKITTHLKFVWKNVIFVEGTDTEYIDQICDYNENAEHDDCPDSLASLIRALPKREKNESTSIFY